jgi:hypothetical protein
MTFGFSEAWKRDMAEGSSMTVRAGDRMARFGGDEGSTIDVQGEEGAE